MKGASFRIATAAALFALATAWPCLAQQPAGAPVAPALPVMPPMQPILTPELTTPIMPPLAAPQQPKHHRRRVNPNDNGGAQNKSAPQRPQ